MVPISGVARYTHEVFGSSQVVVKKILIEGGIRGKRGKFAYLASGEEANYMEKDCEVYCPQDY